MWLLRIAWRNFCYRSLSSLLTTVSLALGVALVVMVLAIFGIVTEAFSRNAQVGYNLVVGPKGSALQLTLNSVYYLSRPIENLPYTEYMEYFPAAERAEMVRRFGGDPALGERDGIYASYVAGGFAIPLALGDYLSEFRVVGTTPDFFEKLRHGPTLEEKFSFSEGRALKTHSDEYGYFEAVLGSRVARQMNLSVGDTFQNNHGDPEGKGHGQGFTVVGIMDPTGTPNDRAAFVNLEGFYLLEGHSKPVPDDVINEPATDPIQDASGKLPLTIPEREVTSILVRTGMPMLGVVLETQVNESVRAQAAAPVGEIARLMEAIVGPMLTALLVITLITCVVAAVGVLVAIYNSMNDRRRDIAVMRALGARRETVTGVILMESMLIASIGAIAGWFLAHVAIWFFSGEIEDRTGVQVGILTTSSYEGWVFPLVAILALLAGLLPALSAYRTDVGTNLSA
ncbi:ABC transporter permease [Rhodopirellula sp. MGV]|uniref:ABC transporter permease n=1 Tax=Rhodopirellula sp. MGV TaxID=2023130 RepID=UPI000B964F14|nr:FtsX-like permease family protein [Rhodopirellula sp. MGV]OYP36037.1 peptide ABC transporter permease [Rhodopirellula sp. MGV]PNY36604.1 peptide ABC transporter permease [Rhodopirellula baltica]